MVTDEDLIKKVDEVLTEYRGQIDQLATIVGMIVLGRLLGWRVIRLVMSRDNWAKGNKLFGDLKDYMPERGPLAHKSVALKISDKLGIYWEMVKGVTSHSITMKQKRTIE